MPGIKLLVAYGADVNAKDDAGNSLITDLLFEDVDEDRKILKFLLEHEANVNAQDSEGNTLLHNIIVGKTKYSLTKELTGLLLDYGARVDIKNNKNQTVMDLLKLKGKSTIEIQKEIDEVFGNQIKGDWENLMANILYRIFTMNEGKEQVEPWRTDLANFIEHYQSKRAKLGATEDSCDVLLHKVIAEVRETCQNNEAVKQRTFGTLLHVIH